MKNIRYLLGDGHEYTVAVRLIGNYPRGRDDLCAFCLGDPCNDHAIGDDRGSANIRLYYQRNPAAVTCPMCDGRAS